MTRTLEAIGDRASRGEKLDRDDAEVLWDSKDLVRLGMLADDVRKRRHAEMTTYVRVAGVSIDRAADVEIPATAGEIRLTDPLPAIDEASDVVARLVARAGSVPVTAGALEDLEALGTHAAAQVAGRLKAAGLHAIASAAIDRLVSPRDVVDVVQQSGLSVARFVVGGALSGPPWPIFARLQAVQRATGAVRAFAPLSREHQPAQPSTGYADVKLVALARLLLDEITTIQVDWTHHGPKLAQVALLFGADDIDGVSVAEDDGTGRRRAPAEQVRQNILAASLRPVERDGRYTIRVEAPRLA